MIEGSAKAGPFSFEAALSREGVGAPALKGPTIGGPPMDTGQEIEEARAARIEAAALGRDFEREAHLDVGGRQPVSGEPARRAEGRLQIIQRRGDLGVDPLHDR